MHCSQSLPAVSNISLERIWIDWLNAFMRTFFLLFDNTVPTRCYCCFWRSWHFTFKTPFHAFSITKTNYKQLLRVWLVDRKCNITYAENFVDIWTLNVNVVLLVRHTGASSWNTWHTEDNATSSATRLRSLRPVCLCTEACYCTSLRPENPSFLRLLPASSKG